MDNEVIMHDDQEYDFEKVHLTFAFKPEFYLPHKDKTTRGVSNGAVEHGQKEGSDDENKILNFWVLFFEKGQTSDESKLKYKFNFNLGNDPETNLTGPIPTIGGYYQTPVKLVDPGDYILLVIANTVQYRFDKPGGRGYQDIIDEVVQPAIDMTFADFKTQSATGLFMNQNPRTDKDAEAFKQHGLNATYFNENFVVPKGFYSKINPYVTKIELQRILSKLVVTINNLNDDGTLNVNTANYQITSIKLHTSELYNPFQHPQYWNEKNIEWTDIDILNLPNFKTLFPLLNELSGGNAFDRKIEEKELFNHYLPPWATGSTLQNQTNYTHLKITVKEKTSDLIGTYIIPLYDEKNASLQKKFTIGNNILYELRITFLGPTMIVNEINYNRIEWADRNIIVPTFE